jgi:hypothetical protein
MEIFKWFFYYIVHFCECISFFLVPSMDQKTKRRKDEELEIVRQKTEHT